MLDIETPIPTPSGWTRMGDLIEGDTVFDEKGCPCTVIGAFSVDNTPVSYELEFDDGSIIRACADHLWKTFDAKQLHQLTVMSEEWKARRRSKRPSRALGKKSAAFTAAISARNSRLAVGRPLPEGSVRNTQEIADTLTVRKGRHNHAVGVAGAIYTKEIVLPIDPYVLGAWLGDGTSSGQGFTGIDPEIWQNIERAGYVVNHSAKVKTHHCIIGLRPKLTSQNLIKNKHVPIVYFRSSEAQRLALLQGLMDTDGTLDLDGGAAFDNTRKCLADAVYDLVVSLGMKATICEDRAKLYDKDCGPCWRVKFMPNCQVFRLTRKAERIKPVTRRVNRFRYIVAARPIDPVPMRCIAVDSPSHLYLAGRSMIPTHNTDLALGLAVTKHHRTLLLRRESVQLEGVIDRGKEIIGKKAAYNGTKKKWTFPGGRTIELGGCQTLEDRKNYQGRPHDLIAFDEAANFLKAQVEFIAGWLRHESTDQKCTELYMSNPPTSAEGQWLIEMFAPWLDDEFPDPAVPGEIRWVAKIDDKETWVDNGDVIVHTKLDGKIELIQPKSRTFIPASVDDNPAYLLSGYKAQLQALPEPLRSMMLYGDFGAGREDNEWQVIPTAWIRLAMSRWASRKDETHEERGPLTAVGGDIARGGKDKTVFAPIYSNYVAALHKFEGSETPTGQDAASLFTRSFLGIDLREVDINLDVIGVGTSAVDHIQEGAEEFGYTVHGVNFSTKVKRRDKSRKFRLLNYRAQAYWGLRELLDPDSGHDIALPPDNKLLADLVAHRYFVRGNVIQIESKEEIKERVGRSPDDSDAVALGLMDTHGVITSAIRTGLPEEALRSTQSTELQVQDAPRFSNDGRFIPPTTARDRMNRRR